MIKTEKLSVNTRGKNDIVNLTQRIQTFLSSASSTDGFLVLFVQSTTSSLTIMEYEDGLVEDIPKAMERIAPKKADYSHERAYHDGNGHSHVRSSIVGTSLTVPFAKGKMLLGPWQQIVLMEFDVRPKNRTVVMQVVSD